MSKKAIVVPSVELPSFSTGPDGSTFTLAASSVSVSVEVKSMQMDENTKIAIIEKARYTHTQPMVMAGLFFMGLPVLFSVFCVALAAAGLLPYGIAAALCGSSFLVPLVLRKQLFKTPPDVSE